jgi:hypothetical protein
MKNIKTWNEFSRINELRTETYAEVANRTGGYPVRLTYAGVDSSGKKYVKNPKGEQEGRINRLAKERFQQEFLKEFKPGTIINNGGKEFALSNIKFESNYMNYTLIFEEVSSGSVLPKMLYISYDPREGYYIENEEDNLDDRSKKIISDMFKYRGR